MSTTYIHLSYTILTTTWVGKQPGWEVSAGGQLGKRLLMTDVKLSNSVSSDDIFVARQI